MVCLASQVVTTTLDFNLLRSKMHKAKMLTIVMDDVSEWLLYVTLDFVWHYNNACPYLS